MYLWAHSLPAANRRLSPRYTLSCNILRIYVPQILGRRVASRRRGRATIVVALLLKSQLDWWSTHHCALLIYSYWSYDRVTCRPLPFSSNFYCSTQRFFRHFFLLFVWLLILWLLCTILAILYVCMMCMICKYMLSTIIICYKIYCNILSLLVVCYVS